MKAGDIYRKFPNEVRGVILFLIIQIALIILKILGFMDINLMIVLLPVVIHLVIIIFLIAGKLCMVLLSPLWLCIAIAKEKEDKRIVEMAKKNLEAHARTRSVPQVIE